MKNVLRPVMQITSTMLLFVAGCDSATPIPTAPNEMLRLSRQVISTTAPITGIWSAVVTSAADLNSASFGRPASDWVGRTVTGSFSIHLTASGVGDRDGSPTAWELGPVPGPGPYIEFVTVTALIDGQTFQTSSAAMQGVFFGDVVRVLTSNVQSLLGVQDSHVGFDAAGIRRNVIGFDTFFGPGGLSFDGTALTINPGSLLHGTGVIDDLVMNGSVAVRQGSITFSVTKVSVSPAGGLLGIVIDLAGRGLLQPNQVTALVDKLNEIALKFEAGISRAACNQLGAFLNQVQALVNGATLTPAAAQSLMDEAQLVIAAAGC